MIERGHGRGGCQLGRHGPDTCELYPVPSTFASRADRLVDRVEPRAGERVLDVGRDTGVVARRVVHRVGDEGATFQMEATVLTSSREDR